MIKCIFIKKKNRKTDINYSAMTGFMTIWFNANALLGSPENMTDG